MRRETSIFTVLLAVLLLLPQGCATLGRLEAVPRQDTIFIPGSAPTAYTIDQLFNNCRNPGPTVTTPFNSNGRWLPGTDFSDGWAFAWYAATLYNHVAPPNWEGLDCAVGTSIADVPGEHSITSARSFHPGGVNACMADGSVRFVKSTVNVLTWRAIGSRNLGEVVSADAY